MKSRKVIPRVIVEFRNGLEKMPEIFSCADTLEEAERAEEILKESLRGKAPAAKRTRKIVQGSG